MCPLITTSLSFGGMLVGVALGLAAFGLCLMAVMGVTDAIFKAVVGKRSPEQRKAHDDAVQGFLDGFFWEG